MYQTGGRTVLVLFVKRWNVLQQLVDPARCYTYTYLRMLY